MIQVLVIRPDAMNLPALHEAPVSKSDSGAESEILNANFLIAGGLEAAARGLLKREVCILTTNNATGIPNDTSYSLRKQYVHRLSAMSEDLKYSYVIIGMKDNGATLGCRTFLPNYTIGMISKDQNLLWYGDIVVGKLKRGATGNETYHDFEAADYPLIRNYFYHM
ncbi:hypothetical protein NUW54_g1263 [Trametes sanguinea]|uniref:Uncharacterized protein n=1 Tax=Trametes sanguinea TaxID=158606 RepID=A0ACC1Q6V1_9APHY|nr:hypothetical protein NUW54_g1263 [Trametes sanguinea]